MKTILVVDDEYALAESLVETLRHQGYLAVSAANGLDALERVRQEKPDLILTDYMMPIADGKDLVRSVRALPESRAIPIVMMSAASKNVALADEGGRKMEVSGFLAKPFMVEEVLELVEQLIGKGVH
jgi:CheY-like chemotaxis protein